MPFVNGYIAGVFRWLLSLSKYLYKLSVSQMQIKLAIIHTSVSCFGLYLTVILSHCPISSILKIRQLVETHHSSLLFIVGYRAKIT